MNLSDIIPADHYIKATGEGGMSLARYEPKMTYKIGLNVHPHPDKSSAVCGEGIHLAKTFEATKNNCPGAKEYYLAKAGVIYGEDNEKVRCGYIHIVKKLSDAEVNFLDKGLYPGGMTIPQNPICGQDWIEKNWWRVPQIQIDNQTLEIKTDKQTMTIKAKLNKKGIRTCLAAVQA